MTNKPYRVVNSLGITWKARFVDEESAWGRVLSVNGGARDTPANRATLLRQGWAVKLVEPPMNDMGEGL